MEVTVLWAEESDLLTAEDHMWAERSPITQTHDDVANIQFRRTRENPYWKEAYPELVLYHEDGSTTRGNGRVTDASGSLGRITTCKYSERWNSVETRKIDDVIGVWWESESPWYGGRENYLHGLYKRDDGKFGIIGGVKPDYAHLVLPNGDSHTRGKSPVHRVDRRVTETGDTLTLEVQDTEETDEGRIIDDVDSVEATKWGPEGREFLVHQTDGSTERVYDVVDVEGPRYATCRVAQWNGAPRIRTYFDGLGATTGNESPGGSDFIHNISFRPKEHYKQNISVSRWQRRDSETDETIHLVEPDGTHAEI